jgi:SAM-dependent methyltransferase
VGLGLSGWELEANAALHERVLFDLNAGLALPFGAGAFDAVVCSAGVPYLTRPLETFTDVARVLRPGGVFATAFSTRMLPHKAVLVWRASDDAAHLRLVRHYFGASGGFRRPRSWCRAPARGEPLYAVWARRAPVG